MIWLSPPYWERSRESNRLAQGQSNALNAPSRVRELNRKTWAPRIKTTARGAGLKGKLSRQVATASESLAAPKASNKQQDTLDNCSVVMSKNQVARNQEFAKINGMWSK